ncbi:MAG: hypothetical protein EXR52_00810 [Dehalococcoidia bacterium]|nr:hypothetical protein [Dehalococcoidia bacterium]
MKNTPEYPFRVGAYWEAVRQCLVRFHGMSSKAARDVVSRYRLRLRESGPPMRTLRADEDIVCHEEPFYLACDLAGSVLDETRYWSAYEELLRTIHEPYLLRAKTHA